jgi:SAM-dependent methyltransferase
VTTSSYYESRGNRLVTAASLHVRRRVFDRYMAEFGAGARVLDVGATGEEISVDANFFEAWHPDKTRITAVGIEDASHLARRYDGLTFQSIEPDAPLPFEDDTFDVAFSHAVVEHVVDPKARRRFVSEMLRVARAAFITTPNLYFPLELHTKVPLLHFLHPPTFARLLDAGWFPAYSRKNLRLLSGADLSSLVDTDPQVETHTLEPIRLAGFVSNWIAIARKRPLPAATAPR